MFVKHPHLDRADFYPMTYAIAEAYTQNMFNFKREIEILCTLRGSHSMTTRMRYLSMYLSMHLSIYICIYVCRIDIFISI
jgi:hypothetical protein